MNDFEGCASDLVSTGCQRQVVANYFEFMRCSCWYEDVKGIEVAVDCALMPDCI